MSKNSENSIYSRFSEACKNNDTFNQFAELCEREIGRWIDKLNAENNSTHNIPKVPRDPKNTKISILLPVVPISPNETGILLEYLEEKYLSYDNKTVGGDFFRLRKCLFKKNYKLSSHFEYPE